MLGRLVLLFMSLLVLVAAVPVSISEGLQTRAVEGVESTPTNLDIQDASKRSPIVEPVPVTAAVIEEKRAEDNEDDEDEALSADDLNVRGVTRGHGNKARGITRGKGNNPRGVTRGQGNNARGITRGKGNKTRGVTRGHGN